MPPTLPPRRRPQRSLRLLTAGVLACASLALVGFVQPELPPAPALPPMNPGDPEPETVIVLRDGQRFTGFLVSRGPEQTVLRIAGIDTPLSNKAIERVEVLPPVEERYRQMRAVIDDSDVDRLLLLAEWLRARAQWELALKEIDQALAVEPNHPEALRQRLLVRSQQELASRPRVERNPQQRPGQPAPPDPHADFPLLSAKDVNLIKVYEIDLKDPPRLIIQRETIDQLLDLYKADRRIPQTPEERSMLYRGSPTRVLDLMFRLRARELYPQVQVVDQPRSMRLFRDNVHGTWIQNSCATTRCHGGADAGRLQLYNRRPNTETTVYTNFLILERYRLPDGQPLINYEDPARSPLLQMGLPREPSLHPHPVVPSREGLGDMWRPFFRNSDDLRFQQAVEWIKAMYRPRPDYPIELRPLRPEPIAPEPDDEPVER